MSLRGKLIGFFCVLAAGPLIAVGIFSYVRSMRTLRELIATQSRAIAERAASELRDRYAKREFDFLLLAENAETQRLFRARTVAGRDAAEGALATADAYLRRAWDLLGRSYVRVEFLDARGEPVYRLGEPGIPMERERAGAVAPGEALLVRRLIKDTRDGRQMGTLVVYRESDSTRVASFASVLDPPWTVVSSGAVEEFAAPFARAGLMNLVLVLTVTSVAAGAFILLTRRGTRSLEALTAAADQVGTGNCAPDLPAAGRDEVGRLTAAFGLMVAKVRDMVREIETSRHMAAVGAFAARREKIFRVRGAREPHRLHGATGGLHCSLRRRGAERQRTTRRDRRRLHRGPRLVT